MVHEIRFLRQTVYRCNQGHRTLWQQTRFKVWNNKSAIATLFQIVVCRTYCRFPPWSRREGWKLSMEISKPMCQAFHSPVTGMSSMQPVLFLTLWPLEFFFFPFEIILFDVSGYQCSRSGSLLHECCGSSALRFSLRTIVRQVFQDGEE